VTIVLSLAAFAGCRATPSEEQPATESASTEPTEPVKAAETKAAPAEVAKKEVTSDGYEVIRAQTKEGAVADVEVKAPAGWKVAQPPSTPDPRGGKFELKDALKDLKGKGTLVATIRTNMGTLSCDLYEDKAPNTVANFVGLARGLREFYSGKDSAWVARPYYDNTTFHRVIPGFMIQGGDFAGDGSGEIWYTIKDEVHPSLSHDRAGQLCMANRGPHTNAAQFFITEGAAPHLDGSYSIFGQCAPTDIVNRIARVPQSGPPNNRPLTPVVIEKVSVERRTAGASASAKPAEPAAEKPAVEKPAAPPPGQAVQEAAPK
jgi:peptidyl-prolyl cis-trans isomerase A (cyclophilin A)